MKISRIIFIVFLGVVLMTSCNKFLDVPASSTQNLVKTASDCQLLLDNYSVMNINYPSDGQASSDDYYLSNQSYENPSLTQEDRGIYIWDKAAIRGNAYPNWQIPYRVAFEANLVLETVQKLQGGSTDQVTLNTLRGSALFYRAYAFWQVAQLYAAPYSASSSSTDLGVPMRLTSDLAEKTVRGTVQDNYTRILEDLNEAVGLLPATSSIATRPNKASAYAMLARTYLSMGDYASSLTNASAALQINNQLIDYNTVNPNGYLSFGQRFNKEVIFHSVMVSTSMLSPGYDVSSNFAKIDSNLVNSYEDNDLRKNVFFSDNGDGTFRFVGNYEPAYFSSAFFNGLTVDELYLVRAECYARANQPEQAMNDLNTLLQSRWVTGTYVNMTAISGDDALAKVLIERRKELVMRGQRWTDIRRLNKDTRFAKTLTRNINGNIYSLPPNDLRYTLLIPSGVLVSVNITQNPR